MHLCLLTTLIGRVNIASTHYLLLIVKLIFHCIFAIDFKCTLQACSVVNPIPMSLANSLALTSAAISFVRICRAFWRSAKDISGPVLSIESLNFFLQQSSMLLPLQELFPYGVDPVLVPTPEENLRLDFLFILLVAFL